MRTLDESLHSKRHRLNRRIDSVRFAVEANNAIVVEAELNPDVSQVGVVVVLGDEAYVRQHLP